MHFIFSKGMVAAIVIYNFWTVILRIAFKETSEEVRVAYCGIVVHEWKLSLWILPSEVAGSLDSEETKIRIN